MSLHGDLGRVIFGQDVHAVTESTYATVVLYPKKKTAASAALVRYLVIKAVVSLETRPKSLFHQYVYLFLQDLNPSYKTS